MNCKVQIFAEYAMVNASETLKKSLAFDLKAER